MSRIIVAYYSRSGTTRTVAQQVAGALDADLDEIRDRVDRTGALGYLRTGLEGLLGASTEIVLPSKDPSTYDLVVIGTPVFAAAPSSPVRTYLWLERARLARVAFFVTYGGAGSDRALRQMAELAGKAPVRTLAVRESEAARGAHAGAVGSFCDALRSELTRSAAVAAR